ncbi:MAG: FitA-like ribbon-helix-helix domain-containing protein [Candidatus Halalkalibacterium sp. M3_1C_030]
MAKNILIRDIDEETLEKLKKKAAANNRSLQEELKNLLEIYAGPDIEKVRAMARESIRKYKAEGRKFSDSVDDLREIRESRDE